MADTIRDLLVKIGFDVKDGDLKKADNGMNNFLNTVKSVAEVLSVKLISDYFFNIAKSTVEATREVLHFSQTFGEGVQKVQELKNAAYLADISFENLALGLRMFGHNIGEAISGKSKKMLEAMHAGGISSIRDANGNLKTQGELLGEVSDKLRTVGSAQERINIVMTLFGRGGLAMMNLLMQGSDKIKEMMGATEEYGYIITDANIKAADAFDDNYKKIKIFSGGIKDFIGYQLIDIYNKYLDKFREFLKVHKDLVYTGIQDFFIGVKLAIEPVNIGLNLFLNIINKIRGHGIEKSHFAGLSMLLGLLTGAALITSLAMIARIIITTLLPALLALGTPLGAAIGLFITISGLLYLIYDDFMHFKRGSESVIGHIMKDYPKVAKIFEGIGQVIDNVGKILQSVSDSLHNLINDFGSLKNIGGNLSGVWNKFLGANNAPASNNGQGLFSNLWSNFTGTSGVSSGASNNITNNTTVNLSVPAGTPQQQQDFLKAATQKHFDAFMQNTYKSVIVGNPVVSR